MTAYFAGVNRSIDTGDTYFKEIKRSKDSERIFISKKTISNDTPLKARVDHARYIVDCPNCKNAEFAFEDSLFYCSVCHNSDINGQSRRVAMPIYRKEIEHILGKRKTINRHWWPSETIDDLKNENIKHGLEV